MVKGSHGVMPRSFVFASPAFHLGVKKIVAQVEYDYHVHENFRELVIISKGEARHLTDDGDYAIGPGDVFVIPEGQAHAYADVKNIQINNILFDASSLPLYFYDLELCPGRELFIRSEVDSGQEQALPRIHLDLKQLTKMMNIVDRLESILEERRPGFRLYAISTFYQLMIMLLEAYRGVSEKELEIPEQLARLIAGMEKNYSEPFSVDYMCRLASMSRASLFRRFQHYFRTTPVLFLNRIRIEHASRLLLSSDLNINEIAALTGFSDNSYFSRRFKAATGLAPREFRDSSRRW